MSRKPTLTPEQEREVYLKTRLRDALTYKALARQYGCSEHVIKDAIERERARREQNPRIGCNQIAGVEA